MLAKNYAKFIFDMDGTLVDSKEIVEKAWTIWANKHDIDVERILAVSHGRPAADVIREVMPQLDVAKEIEYLEVFELKNVDAVKPIPGAIEFVSQLSEDDWAIFTSAPRELAVNRLEAASMPIPDVLITVEDVVNGKPNPEGYLLAAEMLGVSAEQCLVFEDAEAGIHSALAAGSDVIAINAAAPHKVDIEGSAVVEDYFDVSVCLNNKLISISKK